MAGRRKDEDGVGLGLEKVWNVEKLDGEEEEEEGTVGIEKNADCVGDGGGGEAGCDGANATTASSCLKGNSCDGRNNCPLRGVGRCCCCC